MTSEVAPLGRDIVMRVMDDSSLEFFHLLEIIGIFGSIKRYSKYIKQHLISPLKLVFEITRNGKINLF